MRKFLVDIERGVSLEITPKNKARAKAEYDKNPSKYRLEEERDEPTPTTTESVAPKAVALRPALVEVAPVDALTPEQRQIQAMESGTKTLYDEAAPNQIAQEPARTKSPWTSTEADTASEQTAALGRIQESQKQDKAVGVLYGSARKEDAEARRQAILSDMETKIGFEPTPDLFKAKMIEFSNLEQKKRSSPSAETNKLFIKAKKDIDVMKAYFDVKSAKYNEELGDIDPTSADAKGIVRRSRRREALDANKNATSGEILFPELAAVVSRNPEWYQNIGEKAWSVVEDATNIPGNIIIAAIEAGANGNVSDFFKSMALRGVDRGGAEKILQAVADPVLGAGMKASRLKKTTGPLSGPVKAESGILASTIKSIDEYAFGVGKSDVLMEELKLQEAAFERMLRMRAGRGSNRAKALIKKYKFDKAARSGAETALRQTPYTIKEIGFALSNDEEEDKGLTAILELSALGAGAAIGGLMKYRSVAKEPAAAIKSGTPTNIKVIENEFRKGLDAIDRAVTNNYEELSALLTGKNIEVSDVFVAIQNKISELEALGTQPTTVNALKKQLSNLKSKAINTQEVEVLAGKPDIGPAEVKRVGLDQIKRSKDIESAAIAEKNIAAQAASEKLAKTTDQAAETAKQVDELYQGQLLAAEEKAADAQPKQIIDPSTGIPMKWSKSQIEAADAETARIIRETSSEVSTAQKAMESSASRSKAEIDAVAQRLANIEETEIPKIFNVIDGTINSDIPALELKALSEAFGKLGNFAKNVEKTPQMAEAYEFLWKAVRNKLKDMAPADRARFNGIMQEQKKFLDARRAVETNLRGEKVFEDIKLEGLLRKWQKVAMDPRTGGEFLRVIGETQKTLYEAAKKNLEKQLADTKARATLGENAISSKNKAFRIKVIEDRISALNASNIQKSLEAQKVLEDAIKKIDPSISDAVLEFSTAKIISSIYGKAKGSIPLFNEISSIAGTAMPKVPTNEFVQQMATILSDEEKKRKFFSLFTEAGSAPDQEVKKKPSDGGFGSAVAGVLKREGSALSLAKSDRGNYNSDKELVGSKYGVTPNTYEQFLGRVPTKEDMSSITEEMAIEIYKKNYWSRSLESMSENKVAELLFDTRVQLGTGGSNEEIIKAMKSAGIKVTGNFDANVMAISAAISDQEKAKAFVAALEENRIARAIKKTPSDLLDGVKNRIRDIASEALTELAQGAVKQVVDENIPKNLQSK